MNDALFFRLSDEEEKEAKLESLISDLRHGLVCGSSVFHVDTDSMRAIPGSTFAYWVSDRVRNLFTTLNPFQSGDRHACVTNPAGDDRRFFRCYWEVPPALIGRLCRWAPMAKGGEFSRYFADIHLLADWDESEQTFRGFEGTVHRPLKRLASADQFFRVGITYSSRTQLGFSARVLPEGCIFHAKGPGVFAPRQELPILLAIMNSSMFGHLLELQMAFGSYEVGVIQRTPIPNLSTPEGERLGVVGLASVRQKQQHEQSKETSRMFVRPAVLESNEASLPSSIHACVARVEDEQQLLAEYQAEIDRLAVRLYRADDECWDASPRISDVGSNERSGGSTDADESEGTTRGDDGSALVEDLISYIVGCVLGRWDVRFVTGAKQPPALPDPFAPLMACSPGMLTGPDGLPLTQSPQDYPLAVTWSGLLVDEEGHPDDVVRRIREVLHLIWGDLAGDIEAEACQIIGVRELRDYFRKPGAGGFWADHVRRYSKSRRRAPIYWLLQSGKKNYAIWLYYHRLDKNLLHKALLEHVQPRLRLESGKLDALRTQRAGAGETGRAARQLERDLERQETLLAELHDFHDTLRRVADLGLEPDLNDGVILNIAPLWEVVPWREAKAYWDDLLAGEYEWSSIGKQLREKGLAK